MTTFKRNMRKFVQLSPNFSKKTRNKRDIKFVIIHYTGMQSEIESLKRLKNPASKVSSHYLINRKGKIYQLVKENKIAWHAGRSKWKNFKNLNHNSIGIELVNKGHRFGYETFPKSQILSLINLCKKLKKKYSIKKQCFLGHSDIAPLRKLDPGEKFPWMKLNKMNIGIYYEIKEVQFKKIAKKKLRKLFFRNLYKIGYRYFNLKKKNRQDRLIIKAFQRRFLQKQVTGRLDSKTLQISHFLAYYA